MSRKLGILAMVALGGVVLFVTPVGQAVSQSISQVFITNFPDIWNVRGKVEIENPVRLAQLTRVENITVPPVKPTETTRLVEAGTLETGGFPRLVLSLHGHVRGSVLKPGNVGVMLIPDEPPIQQAFNELGLVHFSLGATAQGVSGNSPYFASNQPELTVAFQAYKIFLYNTTDKTVTVNLFAYLTN